MTPSFRYSTCKFYASPETWNVDGKNIFVQTVIKVLVEKAHVEVEPETVGWANTHEGRNNATIDREGTIKNEEIEWILRGNVEKRVTDAHKVVGVFIRMSPDVITFPTRLEEIVVPESRPGKKRSATIAPDNEPSTKKPRNGPLDKELGEIDEEEDEEVSFSSKGGSHLRMPDPSLRDGNSSDAAKTISSLTRAPSGRNYLESIVSLDNWFQENETRFSELGEMEGDDEMFDIFDP